MIRVLVCDLGKVLLPFDTSLVWERLEPRFTLPPEAARRAVQRLFHVLGYGRGAVSGEEFHAALVSEAGLDMPLPDFRSAWSDMFWVDGEVLRLVREAQVQQRVLLTNTNDLHWEFIRARFPHVLAPFDHLLASHELGMEKPDVAVYEEVLCRTGCPPGEHLFVDDVQDNVAGALAVGMKAHLHTGAQALWARLRRQDVISTGPPSRSPSVPETPPEGALWSPAAGPAA